MEPLVDELVSGVRHFLLHLLAVPLWLLGLLGCLLIKLAHMPFQGWVRIIVRPHSAGDDPGRDAVMF